LKSNSKWIRFKCFPFYHNIGMMIRLLFNLLPNFFLLLMLIFVDQLCCLDVLNWIPIVVLHFFSRDFIIREYLGYWIKFGDRSLVWQYGPKDAPTWASTKIATSRWLALDLERVESHIVWFETCTLSMYKMPRGRIVD
jgi:hypothetical protein